MRKETKNFKDSSIYHLQTAESMFVSRRYIYVIFMCHLSKEVKAEGYKSLVFVGKSDLDFIVEHYCLKYGIEWLTDDRKENSPGVFHLYSESYILDESLKNAGFLQQLIKA